MQDPPQENPGFAPHLQADELSWYGIITLATMLRAEYERRAITTDLLRSSEDGISETSENDTGVTVVSEMNTDTSRRAPVPLDRDGDSEDP